MIFYSLEKGDLIFIQFPDTLPGLPPSVDERPSTSNSSNSNKEDEVCDLYFIVDLNVPV